MKCWDWKKLFRFEEKWPHRQWVCWEVRDQKESKKRKWRMKEEKAWWPQRQRGRPWQSAGRCATGRPWSPACSSPEPPSAKDKRHENHTQHHSLLAWILNASRDLVPWFFYVDCCNRVIVGSKSTMALELNFSGTTVSHIDQLMVWIHLPRTFIEIIFYKSSSRSSSSPLSVAMSSWSWSSSIPCQRLWVHCVAGWPQVGQHCCNPPWETSPHYYLIWTSPAWQFG